jgi:hypothetical protein
METNCERYPPPPQQWRSRLAGVADDLIFDSLAVGLNCQPCAIAIRIWLSVVCATHFLNVFKLVFSLNGDHQIL